MSEPSQTDWALTELGELTEITLGGTPSTGIPAYWGGTVPWMSSGDVHKKIIDSVPGRISTLGLESSNARLVSPPAVAIALAGQGKTRGTAALVQTTLSTNQSVALLRPIDERLDARYLYFNLDHRYDELRNRSMGGGRAGLSGAVLARVPIALPPRDVQLQISRILESLDAQIRGTRRIVDKLRQVRVAVLNQFVDELGGQRVLSLAELCTADIRYGIVQSGDFVADGVPVLAIKDLGGDFETGLHRTAAAIDARYRRSRVAPRDVLLSIKGTIGRVGVVPDHYRGNISREIARLRFSPAMHPHFAQQYLLSEHAQRQLALAVVGTTRAEISIHVLRRFRFPVPDLELQRKIVAGMKRVDDAIRSEEMTLRKLEALRVGLARDLLTGRVRVTVEAAS